jgi:hypothetical protein
VNDELERMWKINVVACPKVVSRHLPEKTGENHGKPQSVLSTYRLRCELKASCIQNRSVN